MSEPLSLQAHWTGPLLAPNVSAWHRVMESVDIDLAARDPVDLIALSRSDVQAPLALLPYLAAERSVNEFDGAWPEERQRAVTAGSMAFHKVQGSRPALDRAVSPFGYDVRVVEWFEASETRRPYTFRLQVYLVEQPWTEALQVQLVRLANAAKNLHTKLDQVDIASVTAPASLFVAGFPIVENEILVAEEMPPPTELIAPGFLFHGGVVVTTSEFLILQSD